MSRTRAEADPPVAFERTLRRWVRDLDLTWTAVPIDAPRTGGDVRVGYTLRLHARPRGRASRRAAVDTLTAPEVRLRALGRLLISYESRLANHRLDIHERHSPTRGQGPDLDATLTVRLRPEYFVPSAVAGKDHAGEAGCRLRVLGAVERP